MDTRAKNDALPIVTTSDRFSFFNQILIARKFTEAISLQGSFNYTHFNNVDGYKDASGIIQPAMKNDHLSFSLGARYKISPKTSIIFNYEQPITEHYINDVFPNLSLGLDMKSSGHDFQVFLGNYGNTIPSYNSLYNQNDFTKGQYVIGFNISRLWNF
jgi:predicted porin